MISVTHSIRHHYDLINRTNFVEIRQNDTHHSCWDYVEVRNGEGPFSSLVGIFCGSTGPPDIFSSSSYLWIKFFSDSVTNSPGFQAVFTAEDPVCGSRLALNATNDTQTIQSPNFGPGNLYPLGVNCEWILDTGNRQNRISVKVVEMDLEDTEGCEKDRLSLEDVNSHWRTPVTQEAGGPLVVSTYPQSLLDYWWRTVSRVSVMIVSIIVTLQRLLHQQADYCGSTTPHEFISVGSTVKVTFRSDATVARAGFRLEYKLASCDRDYDRDHGRVLSPGWPSMIPRNMDCTFRVSVQPDSTPGTRYVSVYFRSFSLSSSTNCSSTYLEVRDGGTASSPRLASLCGHSLPGSLHSSGPQLTFKLHTGQGWSGGYDISYTTSSHGPGCGGKLFGTRGAVTSQNYPANQNSSSDCTWELSVPTGQTLQLRFETFNIHSNDRGVCDGNYVEIIDGLRSANFRRLTPR